MEISSDPATRMTRSKGQMSGIEFVQSVPGGYNHGDATAALCLHGIGGDVSSFQPQLDLLGQKRHIISWNMPGYRNSRSLDAMTFESLAEALIRLIDACKLERVDLIGQSIGGMLAIETAIRYPQRIRSLTLIATTSAFGGRDESFKENFLAQRLAPLDKGSSMAHLADDFIPEITGPDISRHHLELARQSMSAVPENTYRTVLECLVSFNRREEVTRLGQPCCLIAGSEDRNAPATTMQRLSEKIRNAQFHCIDRAGHLVNLEAPDAVNSIIDNFLAEQDGIDK